MTMAEADEFRAQAQEPPPPGGRRRRLRPRDGPSFWRAIAGMAVSVALAFLMVSIELHDETNHRLDWRLRRALSITARMTRVEGEIASDRAEIAAMRRETAESEVLRAVVLAPDATLVRMRAEKVGVDAPAAVLARSLLERRAVLEVSGLAPPPAGMSYVLWWIVAHGQAPVRAAQFQPADGDSDIVTVAIPIPLGLAEPEGAIVTLESRMGARAPSSRVVLRSATYR